MKKLARFVAAGIGYIEKNADAGFQRPRFPFTAACPEISLRSAEGGGIRSHGVEVVYTGQYHGALEGEGAAGGTEGALAPSCGGTLLAGRASFQFGSPTEKPGSGLGETAPS